MRPAKPESNWRAHLHEIIFEADTRAGKIFDILLIWSIILSVLAVLLESVASIRSAYGTPLTVVEWIFTIGFTIEYILRLTCVKKPWAYATSFYGVVDLLAIIPTYLSLFAMDTQYLLVIRSLRLLRVFRVFKLAHYLGEADVIMTALKASKPKITVFLFFILNSILILGSLMYVIEGEENGFTSIPRSLYWAVVTLTTVGYGDISPKTGLGQAVSSIVMIIGYGIIAVPTGIVTVELTDAVRRNKKVSTQACPSCSKEGHDPDAAFCKYCGSKM